QALGKIPHRLAITGIRGKSSITRLIAAGLRGAGYRVMAKTTGSKPVLIYPDGQEEQIKRRGQPTILEQKRLIRKAVREKVDFLVTEMMSIRPECLRVESSHLIKPEILVLSNIRPDHLEELGQTEEQIAVSLSSAFLKSLKIFTPGEEAIEPVENLARKACSSLFKIDKNSFSTDLVRSLPYPEFEVNVRLAIAVLKEFGLKEEEIREGLIQVHPDYGCLRAWEKTFEGEGLTFNFVSLFAANDPKSTEEAMKMIIKKMGWESRPMAAVLILRPDRGDRTRQWLDYLLESGEKESFIKSHWQLLAFSGPGSQAAARYLRRKRCSLESRVRIIKEKKPEKILKEAISQLKIFKASVGSSQPFSFPPSELSSSSLNSALETGDNLTRSSVGHVVIFGLGNIVGPGQEIIDYLERTAHALKL
ncbi:MAG TPA: poly-gamma-glutamate synthase PgsB, partial [Candidatus Aminicenantes bacterium]|nr:poly-gamma-glutamate synthase PgsB [Candidatus Aminicenantes bacterium]